MKMVDLSHTMNVHTPGWVGYAGNKMYYAQNLQTQRIVAQRIDTALHVGTHFDGALHATDGRGDMASYPLDYLVNRGAIIDVSEHMADWTVITPAMLSGKVAIEKGDILIIHTGWHRYYEGQPEQDLVRYFCMHPGGGMELLRWMLEMEIKWFGIDCGSADHPMNTTIRLMRPDIARQFEEQVGMSCEEFFPRYEYTHRLSGRKVRNDLFPFHNYAFQEGLQHAENVGGDIEQALNSRCLIGAFPWKYEGLESCPCRIVAFFDLGEAEVEQIASRPGA
jgi:kynurenine formamidase